MQTNNPKYILVHCSDIDSKVVFDQFAGVNRTHRDERNFNTSSLGFNVGYHVFVTGGVAYRARVDTEYGNHCNKHVNDLSLNFQSLGICMGVDGDIELPDETTVVLVRKQINEWMTLWNIPKENVLFHRDFDPGKSCPGSLIDKKWLETNIFPAPEPVKIDIPVPEIKVEPKAQETSFLTWIINLIRSILCIK